ncbi:hypothetical protein MD535_01325 [Vibrio sp. ZSDZ65]|uniref:Uncharacterized protein n=1 Tax=Vibrio qingdaonensis TaxID=2829491 RepID=A0A9X3CJM1_9VIBR|nr:hypothetical protein [Vibrio qingdaonensis]MCW8344667.1 hypothetical protein [Vibrio qingdaonensis]
MSGLIYEGQRLNQPIAVQDIKSGESVKGLEDLFLLREVDFERLKNGANKPYLWMVQAMFAVGGYLFSILPQILDDYKVVTKGQWIVLVIGGIICLAFGIWGRITKDKKKEVMDKIELFFSDED